MAENNSETIVQLLSNVGKILVLLLTDSLILIQLVYCVIALVQLTFLYFYAKRRYTWLDLKEKPDFDAISQKNSVLAHQLSGMVFNNTDVILISTLCDFKEASIYAIYNMFFAQVQTFITSVVSSFTFALGQLFYADREKFDKVFKAYETIYIMSTYIVYTLIFIAFHSNIYKWHKRCRIHECVFVILICNNEFDCKQQIANCRYC